LLGRAYSPKCVEGKFCELRVDAVLGSSPRHFLATLFVTLSRR
jgi:hypothetical protein